MERVGRFVVGVAVARDVHDFKVAKNFVAAQKFAQNFSFLDAGNNPERVLKNFSEVFAGERIIFSGSEQVEKIFYVGGVSKIFSVG